MTGSHPGENLCALLDVQLYAHESGVVVPIERIDDRHGRGSNPGVLETVNDCVVVHSLVAAHPQEVGQQPGRRALRYHVAGCVPVSGHENVVLGSDLHGPKLGVHLVPHRGPLVVVSGVDADALAIRADEGEPCSPRLCGSARLLQEVQNVSAAVPQVVVPGEPVDPRDRRGEPLDELLHLATGVWVVRVQSGEPSDPVVVRVADVPGEQSWGVAHRVHVGFELVPVARIVVDVRVSEVRDAVRAVDLDADGDELAGFVGFDRLAGDRFHPADDVLDREVCVGKVGNLEVRSRLLVVTDKSSELIQFPCKGPSIEILDPRHLIDACVLGRSLEVLASGLLAGVF